MKNNRKIPFLTAALLLAALHCHSQVNEALHYHFISTEAGQALESQGEHFSLAAQVEGKKEQLFAFAKTAEGYFQISPVSSNDKALAVENGGKEGEAALRWSAKTDAPEQQFTLSPAAVEGAFVLRTRQNGQFLEAPNGAPTRLTSDENGAFQFKLIPGGSSLQPAAEPEKPALRGGGDLDIFGNSQLIADGASAVSFDNFTSFPPAPPGMPSGRSFLILSKGLAPVTVSQLAVVNSPQFSLGGDFQPVTLQPGQVAVFEVKFTGTGDGTHKGMVKVTCDAGVEEKREYTFAVEGK